ncbi:MAG TPA: HEAT repeat domain-containing protein [Candidatus Polarisedimenticolaceae bacterium]|nr:HEAT repeat domain-containing protein [Candidatus Polarisedimenticolaceae bacterium]
MFLHAPGWSCVLAVVSLLLGCRDSDPAVAYKELRSERAQVRADAASRLGQARAAEAVGSLAAMLDDPDETVRVTAVRALGQIGDRQALPALVRRAEDPLGSVRLALCQALGQLGDAAAIPTLTRLLHDPDETIRLSAARALGKMDQGAGDRTLLTAALQDPSETVRRHARKVLAERGGQEALPQLTAALAGNDEAVRARAAQVLGEIAHPAALPALLPALDDPSAAVRAGAAQALGRIAPADPAVLAALKRRLALERDTLCQVDLAWNLAKGGDRSAVPRIRELLAEGNPEVVRAEAAMALGEVGDKTDIALLHRALDGGTGLVRKQASMAVQKLEKT